MRYFHEKKLSTELGIHANARPGRYVEQASFDLRLSKDQTVLSIDPVFSGLFSRGWPSQFILGWVDGDYYETITFPPSDKMSINARGLDVQLFRILGGLIPPGGSLMVSYSLFSKESEIHKETNLELVRGYPPVLTPLGFLLFQAGCGMGFKDWYFSEGGREGPPKLQGFKPVSSKVAKEKAGPMIQDMQRFMEVQSSKDEVTLKCKRRADSIIKQLLDMR